MAPPSWPNGDWIWIRPMDADAEAPFVDLVSNLLGVIILLTLIAILLQGGTAQRTFGRVDTVAEELPFLQPERNNVRPFTAAFAVTADGILPIPMHRIAMAMLEQPEAVAIALDDIGLDVALQRRERVLQFGRLDMELGLLNPPYRDLNEYRVSMTLREGAFEREWMDGEGFLALPLMDPNAASQPRPLFYVYADGFDLFADLHAELQSRQARFRWLALTDEDPLVIYHDVSKFARPDYRS